MYTYIHTYMPDQDAREGQAAAIPRQGRGPCGRRGGTLRAAHVQLEPQPNNNNKNDDNDNDMYDEYATTTNDNNNKHKNTTTTTTTNNNNNNNRTLRAQPPRGRRGRESMYTHTYISLSCFVWRVYYVCMYAYIYIYIYIHTHLCI